MTFMNKFSIFLYCAAASASISSESPIYNLDELPLSEVEVEVAKNAQENGMEFIVEIGNKMFFRNNQSMINNTNWMQFNQTCALGGLTPGFFDSDAEYRAVRSGINVPGVDLWLNARISGQFEHVPSAMVTGRNGAPWPAGVRFMFSDAFWLPTSGKTLIIFTWTDVLGRTRDFCAKRFWTNRHGLCR